MEGKLFYTIGEVAGMLGESVSAVRFWSDSFSSFVKPERNGKLNRLYRSSDIEALRQIRFLVKTRGMTIEGAGKEMRSGRGKVENRVKALECLERIKGQLEEIKSSIQNL